MDVLTDTVESSFPMDTRCLLTKLKKSLTTAPVVFAS